MDKVKQVAAQIEKFEVFTPSSEAATAWGQLLKEYGEKLIPADVVKGTKIFKENQVWINNAKKEGYNVVDAGGGTTSTFYNMEKEIIYGAKKSQ